MNEASEGESMRLEKKRKGSWAEYKDNRWALIQIEFETKYISINGKFMRQNFLGKLFQKSKTYKENGTFYCPMSLC